MPDHELSTNLKSRLGCLAYIMRLSHSVLRPSCLQATIASFVSQKSSHTVPHCPWRHTSTRPSSFELFLPPTSRISVLLQVATADICRDNIFILATGHSYGTYQWLQCNYNILVSMHTHNTQLYLLGRTLLLLHCDYSHEHQLCCEYIHQGLSHALCS